MVMRSLVLWLWSGTIALVVLGGCSQYVEGYRYTPQPALVSVASSNPQEQSPATTLVSVVGVRRPDAKANIPESVEIRMRIQNTGSQPVTFDPTSLRLLTGDLKAFPAPQTSLHGAVSAGPGMIQDMTAYFPFPAGTSNDALDITSLILTWDLQIKEQHVPGRTQFTLVAPNYYYYGYSGPPYPYYYDPWFYGGVGFQARGGRHFRR